MFKSSAAAALRSCAACASLSCFAYFFASSLAAPYSLTASLYLSFRSSITFCPSFCDLLRRSNCSLSKSSFFFSASTILFCCLIFAVSPSADLLQSSSPAVAFLNSAFASFILLLASEMPFFKSEISTLNLVVTFCSGIISPPQ